MIRPFHLSYNLRYSLLHPWKIVSDFLSQGWWFLQRGWRGYADCDTWDIGSYLNEWLPEAIRKLESRKIGYPIQISDILYGKDFNFEKATPEQGEAMEAEWHRIMKAIADGFEAARIIEEEVLYPQHRDPEKRELYYNLEKKVKEGMALFPEWYGALWD